MWFVIIGTCLVAAVFDIRQRRIPNWLTLPVFAAGLLWNGCREGPEALGSAALAALLLALPFILLFAAGVGGAGDAKLMGALGAWLRLPNGLYLLAGIGLSGAVIGLIYALFKGRSARTLQHLSCMTLCLPWILLGPGTLRERAGILPSGRTMTRMPYGIAILIGSCATAGGMWLWGT